MMGLFFIIKIGLCECSFEFLSKNLKLMAVFVFLLFKRLDYKKIATSE